MKVQKESLKPALIKVKSESSWISKSGDLAKNIHIVNGRHARKTRPYVILKAKDKKRDLGTTRMGNLTIDRGTRNWHRIIHFGVQGVNPTSKIAGQSKGRSTQSKAFVFFDPDGGDGLGKLIVVKKINHTGNLGFPIFDKALRSTENQVQTKFNNEVISIVNRWLKSKGFK